MDARDSIDSIYADVLSHQTPNNEANTCAWIIIPVLNAIGYRATDISSQGTTIAGTKPDYSILSSQPQQWFLEAKAWNVPLDAAGAAQAVGYANERGKRWAVLTNGRKWQVFDSFLAQKPAAERLVAEADYDQPEFSALLDALSKDRMLAETTDSILRQVSLPRLLKSTFLDSTSDVFLAIHQKLRSRIQGLTQLELKIAIADLLSDREVIDCVVTAGSLGDSPSTAPNPLTLSDVVSYTLNEAFSYTYTWKPLFESGFAQLSAQNYTLLALGVLKLLMEKGCKFPDDSAKKSGVYFTTDAELAATKMQEPKCIEFGTQTLWYEGNRSANNHVKMICRVLELNNFSLSSCRITAIKYAVSPASSG